MAKKFICASEKYEVGGQKEDVIALPVSLSGLPSTIEVEGYTLFLKTSFHVSLVCIGKIAEKNGIQDSKFVNKVVADFCDFIKHTSIEFQSYKNEFRFATQAKERSVVVMCNISNLDRFFDYVHLKYGLSVEYPPTHVTLYTLQPGIGIFLTDSEDIESITKLIPEPVGITL